MHAASAGLSWKRCRSPEKFEVRLDEGIFTEGHELDRKWRDPVPSTLAACGAASRDYVFDGPELRNKHKIRADAEVTIMTFLLLVTWLAYGQPPSDYQVPFSSNEACEAARLLLIKDAERIGQAMIERANAQDRQIGGNNKTALLMAAISNAPYVSAVCVQTSAS
jgi:hypothetical protein